MERLMIATFLVCFVAAGAALAETTATDDAVAADVRQPEHVTVGDAELAGGTWEVYIKAIPTEGIAGTDWDLLTVTAAGTGGTGTFSITATLCNPLIVKIFSLDENGNRGPVYGFVGEATYSWKIVDADAPIAAFPSGTFIIDKSDFYASESSRFRLEVGANDTDLYLTCNSAVLCGDEYSCWDRLCGASGLNILALIGVRNHLGQDPTSPETSSCYDVNDDGAINILDMICVRNRLGLECPSCR